MSERVIPLVDQRTAALAARVPAMTVAPTGLLTDARGRPLRDLRISVTDRCNFRCNYCMPKEVFDKGYPYLPHSDLLSFEEITRLTSVFLGHGVRKIRLTGGEPLLRRNIEALISQLAALRTRADKGEALSMADGRGRSLGKWVINGITEEQSEFLPGGAPRTVDGNPPEITLTTNGPLLARKARALREAGLQRVTVSLDGLDDAVFQRMNDVGFPVADVLEGIDAARHAGLHPVKVNMVVKRGTNEHEILPMAKHFRGTGVILRFIEYMDVGATNGWRMDEVLPSAEVIERLRAELPLVPLDPAAPGETAERWGHANAQGHHDPALGEVGVISSVTKAFCGDCNRARLSTEGQLYLCLFATQGHDLRSLLRSGASDTDIASAIGPIWQGRSDRYSELRGTLPADARQGTRRVEMSYIGG